MPWNDWYHIMCHTYGTWLPGNSKGFRTRHHREHIEGDYKNPPPAGRDARRFQHAKELMKRDPIYLDAAQRHRAVDEIVRAFTKRELELKSLSIYCIHLHALARLPDHNPRHHMGVAKRECSHYMKVDGLAPAGGLWGVRCECVAFAEQGHFENVDDYILDHRHAGAAVYPATTEVVILRNDMDGFDPASLLLS